MKVRLIAVGTKMPDWVQKGFNEYAKRLPRNLSVELVELQPGYRAKNASTQSAMDSESQAIIQTLGSDHCVALDVGGKAWSTENLSEQLEQWQLGGQNLSFVIGGPDGFTDEVRARAQQKWSLSPLTLPHPLVRVVFIEQFYRAHTLLAGHPYHK